MEFLHFANKFIGPTIEASVVHVSNLGEMLLGCVLLCLFQDALVVEGEVWLLDHSTGIVDLSWILRWPTAFL